MDTGWRVDGLNMGGLDLVLVERMVAGDNGMKGNSVREKTWVWIAEQNMFGKKDKA